MVNAQNYQPAKRPAKNLVRFASQLRLVIVFFQENLHLIYLVRLGQIGLYALQNYISGKWAAIIAILAK